MAPKVDSAALYDMQLGQWSHNDAGMKENYISSSMTPMNPPMSSMNAMTSPMNPPMNPSMEGPIPLNPHTESGAHMGGNYMATYIDNMMPPSKQSQPPVENGNGDIPIHIAKRSCDACRS